MSQNVEKCEICRYFEHPPAADDPCGRCRRWAPRPETQPVKTIKETHWRGLWPTVFTTDWCGEFEPALEPTEATAPAEDAETPRSEAPETSLSQLLFKMKAVKTLKALRALQPELARWRQEHHGMAPLIDDYYALMLQRL